MQTQPLQQTPTDVVIYQFVWTDFLNPPDDPILAGDTIVLATVAAAPDGLTLGDPSITPDGDKVRVFVGPGGSVGNSFTLTCTVHTASGMAASAQRILQIVNSPR
jgi:hypothetical protein